MRVLTLGSLIQECFKCSKVKAQTILKEQDWTSIQQYESDADDIKTLRNDILHYGKRFPTLPLEDTERKDFIAKYDHIVNHGKMVEIAAITDVSKISQVNLAKD